MQYLLVLIPVAMLVSPLYAIYRRREKGKNPKLALVCQICAFFGAVILTGLVGVGNALAADAAEAAAGITDMSWGLIAAALATGLSGIGGGLATAAAASAALGAISENEKLFGKAMLFVGLAEGIALYGLIVSLMILGRF
ncbi:MAG: ATP synthase subunit C [Oscillospiraceae bacterium]|jgi:V/A-type H+-transporting ATPase subunit K|nr:ATP synthase subunit C [Oscillospiraceae bacterium]